MTVNRSTCSYGGVADNKIRWVEFRLRVTLVAVEGDQYVIDYMHTGIFLKDFV